MPRIAFSIDKADKTAATIRFFPASALDADSKPVIITFVAEKDGLQPAMFSTAVIDRPARRLMKALAEILYNTAIDGCPLRLCRALLEEQGCQVVLDSKLGRFRNIGTAKDSEDTWALSGLGGNLGMSVEASDEAGAIKRAKKAVADAMQEEPEKAEALAKFFSGGCKVKKLESGKLPPYINIVALATNEADGKLALQPIKVKLGSKKDKDEKKED